MDPSLFFSCEKIEIFFSLWQGKWSFFLLSCMWFVFSAAMVVSVWNFTGSVDIDNDGSWVSTGEKRHKNEKLPSLVSRFCEFSYTVFSVFAIQFIQFHIISLFVERKHAMLNHAIWTSLQMHTAVEALWFGCPSFIFGCWNPVIDGRINTPIVSFLI